MDFGAPTYLLGFVAGLLSTLSPCVLPLVPILVATALGQHRFGPAALAAGLTLSFAAVGLFIATIGVAIGLDQGLLRQGAGLVLALFGIVLLAAPLQRRLATATSGLGAVGTGLLARSDANGWRGQFAVGLVLGLAWSPCVGPTLGAATTLAAQGRHLGQIAVLMVVFGLGAGVPLLILGTLSREAVLRWRGRLQAAGRRGKLVFGVVLLALGAAIVTGADKGFETWAVDHSPDWLTALTTRY